MDSNDKKAVTDGLSVIKKRLQDAPHASRDPEAVMLVHSIRAMERAIERGHVIELGAIMNMVEAGIDKTAASLVHVAALMRDERMREAHAEDEVAIRRFEDIRLSQDPGPGGEVSRPGGRPTGGEPGPGAGRHRPA